MNIISSSLVLFFCSSVINLNVVVGIQSWVEEPSYSEVNPGGSVEMKCVISNKVGECRWSKDGTPVGIYPNKYEWTNSPDTGDCSLTILDANLEYDDGVWQCDLTPSTFSAKDALISEGAQLVVRESPNQILIQQIGDGKEEFVASAGEDLELECIVSGGNPPAKLQWYLGNQLIQSGHTQEDTRSAKDSRTWNSISRLTLPVNKQDNGQSLKCTASHPTLNIPLEKHTSLIIHYPPTVVVETSSLEYLEDGKDPVTLKCLVDSNPRSTIIWKKDGQENQFSNEAEIHFSPITRRNAGLYSCSAHNAIGRSKQSVVKIDVKYSPQIISVGPNKKIEAKMYNKTLLTCEAAGNPTPRYQWLQKLPTQEVLIRGYSQNLLIENVTYDHQGEFVCKAINEIRGEERAVQSEAIHVQVSGAPQIIKYSTEGNLQVQNGEDAVLEVLFCSDPVPKQSWHLGDVSGNGAGNNIILAAGTGHKRFIAEKEFRQSNREDCYISTLRINGAHPTDSGPYELKITNKHGIDNYIVNLTVRDKVSQESLIAVAVGCVLTLLLLILLIIYCVKANKCCCCSDAKKDFKPSDLESDKTDLESTHSSSLKYPQHHILPPDALYASRDKTYINYNDPIFNDSKESLRPDLIHQSNLNRTTSSSGELPHYNDLCFPKTSNYGSMKVKKNKILYLERNAVHNNIYDS